MRKGIKDHTQNIICRCCDFRLGPVRLIRTCKHANTTRTGRASAHANVVPLILQTVIFSSALLSLCCSVIINITALTRANEDEAGICIISPTWRTSPTPDAGRVSPGAPLNFTCRRRRSWITARTSRQKTARCRFDDGGTLPREEQ